MGCDPAGRLLMIGWVTVMHSYTEDSDDRLTDEVNSIGIYVEPVEDGAQPVGFEMSGARSYEIEAAVSAAFAGEEFDDVDWWTYDQDTYRLLHEQCPELALKFGSLTASYPIVQLFDSRDSDLMPTEEDGPLRWCMYDLLMYLSVRKAVEVVGADLTTIIDSYLK